MKKILFLAISVLCLMNQMSYGSAAKPTDAQAGQTGKLDKENPITTILSMTLLKSCLTAECLGTQGQFPQLRELPLKVYNSGEVVVVKRGFNAFANVNGKIKGNLVATSQGRVKTSQDLMAVLKQAPSQLALYASQVMPIDLIATLAEKDEKEAVEGLTKYFGANLDLLDPAKIYVVEGSRCIYHYTSILDKAFDDKIKAALKAEPSATAAAKK